MPRCGVVSVLMAALLLLVAAPSRSQGLAEGLRGVFDLTVSSVTTRTTDAAGETTEITTNNFYPRLNINADTLLWPSLRLSAGGVFEVNDSSSRLRGVSVDSTITGLRPFVELRSTSALFAPGIGYYRRETLTSSNGRPGPGLVNQDYAAYLTWRPEGLPLTDFQFVRTDTFDSDRLFRDSTKDFGSIRSRYSYKTVNLYYQGSYLGNEDRLQGVDSVQVSNGGRLDHSASVFRKRLLWNTTYHVNRQDLTVSSTGEGGEVPLPVTAFNGLSLQSETPLTATLSPNAALVDGNLTAGPGIDIGTAEAGVIVQAWNLGLDFSSPAEVNRLLVWVDRDLPSNIAGAFSWEIYSSLDNVTWQRESSVPVAQFGPFEFRFQLDFRAVRARYLKVVTRPLSSAVVDSNRYPDILVTELQAFLVHPADEATQRIVRTTQTLNTDVRLRLLSAPNLYYEGSYWFNDAGAGRQRQDTLSNGIAADHRFSRAVYVYGRAAHEQGEQVEGHRVANVTNATLTVTPLETFTASILFTGLDERIDGRPNDRNGLSFQSTSQLYRGLDVQAGFGWAYVTRETGERLRDRFVNLSGSVAPRQNLSLTFNYVDTKTTRRGVVEGDPQYETRSGFVTLAFDPVRALHLALGEEVIVSPGQKTRVTHNVGVNWVPFPDGALQLIFAYNEALRSLEFGTEESLRAGVRWTFSRRSYIELSYQRFGNEYVALRTDSRVLSADLRLFF